MLQHQQMIQQMENLGKNIIIVIRKKNYEDFIDILMLNDKQWWEKQRDPQIYKKEKKKKKDSLSLCSLMLAMRVEF